MVAPFLNAPPHFAPGWMDRLHNVAVRKRWALRKRPGDTELIKGILGDHRVIVLTEDDLSLKPDEADMERPT